MRVYSASSSARWIRGPASRTALPISVKSPFDILSNETEEDTTGGFKYGGWTAGYWDDFLSGVMGEQMANRTDLNCRSTAVAISFRHS